MTMSRAILIFALIMGAAAAIDLISGKARFSFDFNPPCVGAGCSR